MKITEKHFIPLVFLLGFIVIILIKKNKEQTIYKRTVCYNTELKKTLIKKKHNHGIIVVNDSLIINSNCKILKSSFSSSELSHNGGYYSYSLDLLPPPYSISKNKYSDTITIYLKNKRILKGIILYKCDSY